MKHDDRQRQVYAAIHAEGSTCFDIASAVQITPQMARIVLADLWRHELVKRRSIRGRGPRATFLYRHRVAA